MKSAKIPSVAFLELCCESGALPAASLRCELALGYILDESFERYDLPPSSVSRGRRAPTPI